MARGCVSNPRESPLKTRVRNERKNRLCRHYSARNEAERIGKTVEAVAAQTVPPREWVIVDDGSSDGTGEILDSFAERYPWLRVLHRSDRGFRKPGGGVIEAFNEGLAALQSREWEFIVKLDGDLPFEPGYFRNAWIDLARNPRLGIAGGGVYHKTEAGLETGM
jgi:glycosyltransferase involved in cell wall biosynthesis